MVGMEASSYDKILQQGDYSLEKLETQDLVGNVASVYWTVVVAAYLGYSFITNDWGRSWIIWPVAGVLFGGIAALTESLGKSKKRS
jgi:hypothetical protein